MITCYLRYEVRPDKLAEFEAYGAMWLELVPRFGGTHHGYFLPSEGASDVALAIFSFPSLDRKSTRLNSSHERLSRMPSSA